MKQGGENPREYGAQFVESILNEESNEIRVLDAFAHTGQNLDTLLDEYSNNSIVEDNFFTEF